MFEWIRRFFASAQRPSMKEGPFAVSDSAMKRQDKAAKSHSTKAKSGGQTEPLQTCSMCGAKVKPTNFNRHKEKCQFRHKVQEELMKSKVVPRGTEVKGGATSKASQARPRGHTPQFKMSPCYSSSPTRQSKSTS